MYVCMYVYILPDCICDEMGIVQVLKVEDVLLELLAVPE